MQALPYSINVTLEGTAIIVQYPPTKTCIVTGAENLARTDSLLFGRVTYKTMEAAWRPRQNAQIELDIRFLREELPWKQTRGTRSGVSSRKTLNV
jgi:hypothetical protein